MPNRSDAKRLTTGVLVAGVVAAGAVALAGPAAAAATSITATPAQSNYPAGAQATINVTTTGTPTSLMYRITAGPDKTTGTTGSPCNPPSASPSVCSFTNSGTAGTDTVQVFDDVDGSGTYNTGEPQATTSVVFSGNPTALTLSPSNGGSVSAGNPATFTVHATDANGNASAGSSVTISSVETNSSASSTLTYSDSTGTNRSATSDAPGTTAGTFTHTATETVTTDASGNATVKVTSNMAGSVSVTANYNAVKSATSTFTVTGGQTGNNNVSKLSASPTSQTAGTNGQASVTVTATDSSGSPVGGATISYEITSGPDATGTNNYPTCSGTTSQTTGALTCTIPAANNSTAGTDNIEFFVNQTVTGTAQSPGPDSTEPTATASVSFVAQPAYDDITLTTPDQSTDNDNTDATVITGTSSSTFTATVEDENAAGTAEVPVANAVVNFTVTAMSPNGTTVTLNPKSATTNSSGVATTVATPSSTANGVSYTVQAIVGNGSSYVNDGNGDGDSASASVTYASSTAQAPALTPTLQNATIGGSATVTGTVDDQFGKPVSGVSVAFVVTGRNAGQAQNLVTGTNGQAVFTYTDAPTNPTSTQDTVTATTTAGTNNNGGSDTATVDWISGPTAASKIVLALGQSDNGPYDCGDEGNNQSSTAETCVIQDDADSNYADTDSATVTNSSGQALEGVTVTFTASQPFLGSTDTAPEDAYAAAKTTVTAVTNSSGVATIEFGSTKQGNQVTTATVGTATSNTTTVTYQAVDVDHLTLTPAAATITAGGSQKFTANATDMYGNGVSNDEIGFSQNGPGTLNNSFAFTGTDGTASILLTTQSGDSGSGTVTASSEFFEGFESSNQTATSTYSVTTVGVKSLALSLSGANNIGGKGTATAALTGTDGNAFGAGEVVSFKVTGATTATGTATTNSNGVAAFTFTPQHAGTYTVTATDSTNSAATDSKSGTTAKISVQTQLAVSSTSKGKVTAFVDTKPVLANNVVYFYQVTSSGLKYVTQKTTNSKGTVTFTVGGYKSGTTYQFEAKVNKVPSDYSGEYSNPKSVKVK